MNWDQVALVAIPYVVPFIIGLVALGYQHLLARLPATQREEAARIIQVLVDAAEQAMPGAAGADKRAEVESAIEAIFAKSHLNVPPDLVSAFIESAVSALHERQGPSSPSKQVGFQPTPASAVPNVPAA